MSKFLKIAGIGCGGCLVLLIAAGLIGYSMLPTEMHVERSIQIEAPVEVVFPMVDTLKSWPEWDPWSALDSDMDRVYEGPPAGKGAITRWESEDSNVGKGWIEILESVPGDRIVFDLHILQGEEDFQATGVFSFVSSADGVTVTWTDDAELEGFGMRVFGFAADFILGPMFEQGLANLKELSEEKAEAIESELEPLKKMATDAINDAAAELEGALGGSNDE